MLFDLTNLPYWILLGMGVLLFLVVIFVGGGDDDLDLDSDVDVDIGDSLVDLDTDVDLDADADGEFNLGQVLGWLGIGKAPLILLLATDLSLMGTFGWMLNVLLSETGEPISRSLLSGMVFAVSLVMALAVGSLLSRPIGKVFAPFGEDASSDRLIGCIGTVSSAVIPSQQEKRIGQVDVIDPAHNRVTVHAMLPSWATIPPRLGDKVLVIERQLEGYLVIVKDSPDHDHWFNTSSHPKADS
jgi:hypothetical protein